MDYELHLITHELNRTNETEGQVERFHGAECYGFLEQIGLINHDQRKRMQTAGKFSERRNKHLDALSRVIYARMAFLEGNCGLAAALFDSARKRANALNKESGSESGLAYFYFEYANMLSKLQDQSRADLYLEKARGLARSNKLKQIIDYEQFLLGGDSSKPSTLRTWLQKIAYFSKYKMTYMDTKARYDLARHYFKQGELEETINYLEQAGKQAADSSYHGLSFNIEIAKAELLIQQEQLAEAQRQLRDILSRVGSVYLQVYVLNRQVILHDQNGEHDLALALGLEAAELSQRFAILPENAVACVRIARNYHRNHSDINKAFFYFQKAYGSIQDLMELGFPPQREQAEIIAKYVSFLEEHFPGETESAANEELFAYSKDFNWVKIKDLFHYNLFLYHYMNTGVGGRTLEVLDFPASSFYSATERLRSRGITFPNFRKSEVNIPSENYVEGLQQYCRLHREKTWVEINEQFEKDMLAYHYKLNNYNKKVMAKRLELAYSGIVNRTQYLTSSKK